MRSLILAAVLMFPAALVFAQKTEGDSNEAILKKLDEIRLAQEEIVQVLKRIEAKLPSTPAPAQAEQAPFQFPGRGPDAAALEKITLPDNPTKEQARQYLRDIAAASEKQNTFSDQDPQVGMLAKVGSANMDVLLDALRTRGFGGMHLGFWVLPAIKELAGDEHKEMILKRLPQEHELADVVAAKGWAEDARTILMDGFRTRATELPTSWIEAVASLKDPTTYDVLKWYLSYGSNPSFTYAAIKDLPGIELSKEVGDSWERVKEGGEPGNWWEVQSMAAIALEYGHLDALEREVEILGKNDQMRFGPDNMDPRRLILRYTEAHGSSDEIRKWFQENKSRLVFDQQARKFVVKKGE
jgi:hypothetical protein